MKIESKNGIDDVMTTVIVYWMILAVLAAWRSGFFFAQELDTVRKSGERLGRF